MGRPKGSKNKPKLSNPDSSSSPSALSEDYQVRFVPRHVVSMLSGRKPFLFQVTNYLIVTKENKNVLATHLLFGGVPCPDLHNAIVSKGFNLRRTVLEYNSKKHEKIFRLADSDNGCWAAYYNDNEYLSGNQIDLIINLFEISSKSGLAGKTFLCPSWELVDAAWGGKDNWLKLVAAPVKKPLVESPASPAVVDETLILNDSSEDAADYLNQITLIRFASI